MKQGVLDALEFMIENYTEATDELAADGDIIALDLSAAGFKADEIEEAYTWFVILTSDLDYENTDYNLSHSQSTRVFHHYERMILGIHGCGLLMALEQVGLIDVNLRELIIDSILMLGIKAINLEQLKWLILVVLFNQFKRGLMAAGLQELDLMMSGNVH